MGRKRRKKWGYLISVALIFLGGLGAILFHINKEGFLLQYFYRSVANIGDGAMFFQTPGLYLVTEQDDNSFMEILENRILSHYSLYICSLEKNMKNHYEESAILEEMLFLQEENEGEQEEPPQEVVEAEPPEELPEQEPEEELWKGDLVADEEKMYPLSSIKNYELALDAFYQVDSTTMLGEDLLKVEAFLSKDMTITVDGEGPKILIYHTHSQEGYAGSDKTVVDVGNVLTDLLQNKYGISVIHHTGEYDLESRDYAYSNVLPNLITILEEHPTIEVVIDLHRDGVNEDVHLVTTIDGKPTAKIMFFNGVSQTKKNGKIPYLENPYLEDNLAFSFQMQLAARTYYPSFTRDIYIKGYRYNMHLMPKSLLVEVGAQTNTYEEACNAMTYFAELLYRVLTTKR